MQVNRGVAAGTVLSPVASVSSNTSDPNSGNNSASASTTVTNPVTLAAPANQSNYEADAVSLGLSGSDALSGTTLSYGGQGLPPGLSVNGSSGVISGTVSAGDYLGSPFTVTVTASDSTYSANQSFTWTISRLTPSESVTSALNPSTVGQAVIFTATLSGPAGVTPTGTVTFADGSSTLGTATLSVVNGQDIATLGTSALAVGSHTITATYSGDGNFAGSSAALTQTVKALTSTTLTSSLNPSPYGQAVTFTAAGNKWCQFIFPESMVSVHFSAALRRKNELTPFIS